MLSRIRATRRGRSLQLAGVLLSLTAGPRVVTALASTGAPPQDSRALRSPALQAPPLQPPPAPAPIAPIDPRILNAAIPISDAPNPPARPFRLAAAGVLDQARAADCMTAAVYYEAGAESLEGQRAVAQVVLNRLRDAQFPKTVCGVVFQGAELPGCQFTFTCDGALDRRPSDEGWAQARRVAVAALHGYVMKAVGGATHYHADYVAPGWSPALVKVAVVGRHIFYRWPGADGAWRAPGAASEVASLDERLGSSLGKLPLTPVPQEPAAALQATAPPVEIAAAAPAAPAIESAAGSAVDASAAAETGPVLAPGDLDWQGQPRRKGPPRLARPDSF